MSVATRRRCVRSRAIGRLGVFFGALVFFRCGSENDSLVGSEGATCQTIELCAKDEVCVGSRCVNVKSVRAPSLEVEITPPQESRYTRTQTLASFDARTKELHDLEIALPSDFRVVVRDADGRRVAAALTVFAYDGIRGREIEARHHPAGIEDEDVRIRVPAGSHRLRITPLDPSRPTVVVGEWKTRAGSGDVEEKIFQIPSLYRSVAGRVYASGAPSTGLPDVSVFAFETESRLSSTTARTDEDGNYAIALPATDATEFRLVARALPAHGAMWSFEDALRIDPDDWTKREGDKAPPRRTRDIALEIASRETNTRIHVEDEAQGPVNGARVTVTATVGNGNRTARHEIEGTTDARGKLIVGDRDDVTLFDARYRIVVVPHLDDRLRVGSAVFDLSMRPIEDATIALRMQNRVRGRISSAEGSAVAFAALTFTATDELRASRTAQTNEQGFFDVHLDLGRYVLVVEPSTDSSSRGEALPIDWREIDVADDASVDLGEIALRPGLVARGRIVGDSGEPIQDARLEFFEDLAEFETAIAVGRATSDASGSYTVVVPTR